MKFAILSALFYLLFVPHVFAEDIPDFFIASTKCKTTVGFNRSVENNMYTEDGDTSLTACSRNSDEINCQIHFNNGETTQKKYKVLVESGPYLHFVADNNSEYYQVNRSNGTVVYTSRIVSVNILGSKVCVGYFMTKSEYDMMQKNK